MKSRACAEFEFTCTKGAAIFGNADVLLSTGDAHGTGFTVELCEVECSKAVSCASFVYRSRDGYCELWSTSLGAEVSTLGYTHCIKGVGPLVLHTLYVLHRATVPDSPSAASVCMIPPESLRARSQLLHSCHSNRVGGSVGADLDS